MTVRWTFTDYWRSQIRTQTYYFTEEPETFTVPDEVNSLYFSARGSWGGGTDDSGYVSGGYVTGHLADVSPGDALTIRVGGFGHNPTRGSGGAGGYNGGGDGGNAVDADHFGGFGGGGATDVRRGGDTLADRIFVAAGAGGNSGGGHHGGDGGADVGEEGLPFGDARIGGRGGTQALGGAIGGNHTLGVAQGATPGDLGVGGRGADTPDADRNGAGGGGAGYYGGGGGGTDHPTGDAAHNSLGGGGGGSNYTGGFDQTQYIRSVRGTPFDTYATRAVPYVSISWQLPGDSYTWDINPNDGGSPMVTKQLNIVQNTGPNRVNIIQEGGSEAPVLDFSGVILTQEHYEAIEGWYNKRVLILMTDDLGRQFYGTFSKFNPKRQRRASNPWYHTYDAEFVCTKYTNASGNDVYGRVR